MLRVTHVPRFNSRIRPFERLPGQSLRNGVGVALIEQRGHPVRQRGKGRTTTTSMTTITQEQRDAFVRLLREEQQRRQRLFERQLDERVHEEFLPKLVQRQGITGLVGKIGKLSSDLAESARALQSVDVIGRPEGFWSRLVRPEDVNEVLERMKRPHQEEHEQSMREYDLAALRIMSTDTVEEAREIVESLM